jgi:tetratricopeptide (TPR) repeat protein
MAMPKWAKELAGWIWQNVVLAIGGLIGTAVVLAAVWLFTPVKRFTVEKWAAEENVAKADELLWSGDLNGAKAAFELALPNQEAREDWDEVARTQRRLGEIQHDLGNTPLARQHFDKGRIACRKLEVPDHCDAFLQIKYGDLARLSGNLDDATREYRSAGAACHAAGDTDCEANALQRLGHVAIVRGDTDGAIADYDAALKLVGDRDTRDAAQARAESLWGKGAALGRKGRHMEARPWLDKGIEACQKLLDKQCEANATYQRGFVNRLAGNNVGARNDYVRARGLYESIGDMGSYANVRLYEGQIEVEQGRRDDARTARTRSFILPSSTDWKENATRRSPVSSNAPSDTRRSATSRTKLIAESSSVTCTSKPGS